MTLMDEAAMYRRALNRGAAYRPSDRLDERRHKAEMATIRREIAKLDRRLEKGER